MTTALVTTIRESCGYLDDEGWQQTAQLMSLAAHEIERLSERVRELEARAHHRESPPADSTARIVPIAVASQRPR